MRSIRACLEGAQVFILRSLRPHNLIAAYSSGVGNSLSLTAYAFWMSAPAGTA
jgi:hypothetical protein